VEFYDVYSTDNPRIATIGAVVIVILTSIIFFAYDFAMRREVRAKQQMLQAKRKYMRFVSHEVRTPLNAVCMGVTLLQEEIENTCERAKAGENETASEVYKGWLTLLEDIGCSAQSSVHVLNDLLHYDKIESNTLALELSVFPLWDLIQDASSEFKLSAKMKDVSFHVDKTAFVSDGQLASDDIHNHCVVGDEVRLTQVLRNLTSNAIKFTPEGGESVCRYLGCTIIDRNGLKS